MVSRRVADALAPVMKQQYLFWLQGFFSIAMYAVVAYVITAEAEPRPFPTALPIVYGIVGLLSVLLFFSINRMLCPDAKIRQILDSGTDPEDLAKNPKTGLVDDERLASLRQLEVEELRLVALFSNTLGFFVIRVAVADFSAILGLVSAILSGNIVYFYSFAVPSLLLKIMNRPNVGEWVQRLRDIRE